MELTEQDKGILLKAARDSIKSSITNIPAPTINYDIYPDLKKSFGAFVTLKYSDQLRGCIGYIISKTTLFETVCNAAVQAANHDPRFFPVRKNEVDNLIIEISVLSKPTQIKDYCEIEIGIHGLILEYENYRSLLLPQVAVEHNFTVEDFLSALFDKAGLKSSLWKNGKFDIKIFTATVFSDLERSEKKYEQI